jgi:hypothetical protein
MKELSFKKKIAVISISLLVLVTGVLAYIQSKTGYNMPSIVNDSAISTSSSSSDDIKQPAVEIISSSLDYQKNGYYNVIIHFKNNSSETINYVKINMFFKDIDGNVIQSDWTNDSSPVLSGATQRLEKFCKLSNKVVQVDCKIAECN